LAISDLDGTEYSWRVHGTTADYSITLPELPQTFLDKYPGINRDDFTLLGISIYVQDEFESQDEVIE